MRSVAAARSFPGGASRTLGRALLLAAAPFLVTACGPPLPRYVHAASRYAGTATYVGRQANGESAQSATPVDARLVDCTTGSRLVVGPGCDLHGSWTPDTGFYVGADNRGYHVGTLLVRAGQTCALALEGGAAEMDVSSGVVKVDSNRIVQVTLGGELRGGGHATLAFTEPPDGALVETGCPAPDHDDASGGTILTR